MLTDKQDFQNHILAAAAAGTLFTADHHPTGLAVPRRKRTVIAPIVVNNVTGLMQTGNFSSTYYQNTEHPDTPDYVEVEPLNPEFEIPASGVLKNATQPYCPKDRMIFFSGAQQGWHCCGEDAATIQAKVAAGTLIRVGPLT